MNYTPGFDVKPSSSPAGACGYDIVAGFIGFGSDLDIDLGSGPAVRVGPDLSVRRDLVDATCSVPALQGISNSGWLAVFLIANEAHSQKLISLVALILILLVTLLVKIGTDWLQERRYGERKAEDDADTQR
jgi:hypothetical protein